MPLEPASHIWMDGEFVEWDDARVHILTPTLHYGWGVFDGIRAYATDHGPAIFCHRAHHERLHRSAQMLAMDLPYSVDELVDATRALVARTGLESCYIRPVAYLGYGEMGLNPLPSRVSVAIAAWTWGTYLGDEGLRNGVRAKVSSWRRVEANAIPAGAKINGVYVNSSLAKVEALNAGYDEAIMLNDSGEVAEATGENLFVVSDGMLRTPPLASGALRGVTRDAMIRFASDAGIPVAETPLLRQDVYVSDEAFFTGTAAEVVPIRSVDDRELACPGSVTKQLQDVFFSAVSGREPAYRDMLDYARV